MKPECVGLGPESALAEEIWGSRPGVLPNITNTRFFCYQYDAAF